MGEREFEGLGEGRGRLGEAERGRVGGRIGGGLGGGLGEGAEGLG